MKVLILDGSESGDSLINSISELVVKELKLRNHDIKTITLRNHDIKPCLGCFKCWVKTPGRCIIDDDIDKLSRISVNSDLTIVITPVVFGGYSFQLKKGMDRIIPNILPFFTKIKGEIHHKKRYEILQKFIGIGTLHQKDPESEKIFYDLLKRNAINFHNKEHPGTVIIEGESSTEIKEKITSVFEKSGV